MNNSLSKINDPWLRILTGASASFAIVTIVSAVTIGLTTPKNKSAPANKIAIYSSLLAIAVGGVVGFVAGDASFKHDSTENQQDTSTRQDTSDAWTGWRDFQIVKKEVESQEITSFYFKPVDGGSLPDFKPGQFLTIKLDISDQERPVIRTYSLSDYSVTQDYYRLSIKREGSPKGLDVPPGIASNFMHDRINVGSIIPCKPPNGKFLIDIDRSTPAVLISNGVGITPMISMAKAIARKNPQRHVWFLHGARNSEYHACREEVNAIANSSANLQINYSYSRPKPEDTGFYHNQGYVDKQLLEKSILPQIDRVDSLTNAEYYLCGSPKFMDSIRSGLAELGVSEDNVFFESFGGGKTKGKAEKTSQNGVDSAEIVFTSSDRTLNWTKNDGTILEFAEANNIDPPYSCRQGVCLTCMCALEEGEVEYTESPTGEPDEGSVLICIAKPKSSKIVLDL